MDIFESNSMSTLQYNEKTDILFRASPRGKSLNKFIDQTISPNVLAALEQAMDETILSDFSLRHCDKGELVKCSVWPYETNQPHRPQQDSGSHLKVKSFSCPLCNGCFPNRDALQTHKLTKHVAKTRRPCSQCTFVAQHQAELDEHVAKHVHVCEHCGETFATSQKVRKHLRSHVLYRCRYCKFSSICSKTVDQHESHTHHFTGKAYSETSSRTMDTGRDDTTMEDAKYDAVSGLNEMPWLGSNDMVVLCETIQKMLANFPTAESLTRVNQ